MIIGLTGSMGIGKGEIGKLLEKLGAMHITLSSMLRNEAKNRGLEETRDNYIIDDKFQYGAGVIDVKKGKE